MADWSTPLQHTAMNHMAGCKTTTSRCPRCKQSKGLCGHPGYGLTMFDTRIEGKPKMFKGVPNEFLD